MGSWLGDQFFRKFASNTQDILRILSDESKLLYLFAPFFFERVFGIKYTH